MLFFGPACAGPSVEQTGDQAEVDGSGVDAMLPAATADAPAVRIPDVAPVASAPRIYATSYFVRIQPEPSFTSHWSGYFRMGQSVALATTTAIEASRSGPDCDRWLAVNPEGFVCEGSSATLDENAPLVAALARSKPLAGPYPFRYAEVLEVAPAYATLPSVAQQREAELDYDRHMQRVLRARDQEDDAARWEAIVALPEEPAPLLEDLGPRIRGEKQSVWPTATVAFLEAVSAGSRGWALTSARRWVPLDRLKVLPESSFEGLWLDSGVELPTSIHGKPISLSEMPVKIAREGGVDTKWIDVSILDGTLVAYVGSRPVFATLVSAGRGGTPKKGLAAIETAATPTGIFPIDGKFVTHSMTSSASSKLVHAEVPHVLKFTSHHSLHAAYWHDDWGSLKSGGCINLSPRDAHALFAWSDPPLPDGWHGMMVRPDMKTTWVRIRR